ncbi:hypothetical protein [Fluviicola sp.]|uniref:hypothetical protein n=1 Tax=Fluviicola sp. TaxID=1917219 RepID=UPI003D271F8F
MKAKHIILSTFLYGALSLSMLTMETPEGISTENTTSALFSTESSGQIFAQAVPGERRRVRRRTRRRVNRRRDRRENATTFSMNFTKTYIA